MTLKFLNQEFENREQLARAYPAYAGDDAIRAIKDGATTPMEVEKYCHQRSGAFRQKQLDAARANGRKNQPSVVKAAKAQRQRQAGGAKGAATRRQRRKAA